MSSQTSESIERAARALRRNRFDARVAKSIEDARRIVLEVIPEGAVVGIGDSATVKQSGVLSEFEKRGVAVVNPFLPEITNDWSLLVQTMRRTCHADVFLTSVNAVTATGKLMSIDMVGNRVSGMIFTAPTVVLVAGRNKIVRDLEAARKRLKEVICPYHAAAKGRKVPCAKTGTCVDCDAPERICNVTLILEAKPFLTQIIVILVDEDLGLSWEPSWPEERISSIKGRYHAVSREIPVPDEAL
jgi:L-lactate utilization protein LutB